MGWKVNKSIEKVRAAKYYQEHREEIKAQKAKYYAEHREEIKAQKAKYYQEHKEGRKAYDAKHNAKWRGKMYLAMIPIDIFPDNIPVVAHHYNKLFVFPVPLVTHITKHGTCNDWIKQNLFPDIDEVLSP